jgi:hypothetical protein
MAGVIEFTRGDGVHHSLLIPTANWTAGGTLFFGAKPAIDDDATDTVAVLKNSWTDSATSDVTVNGVAYKKYDCYFPHAVTYPIDSGGADELDLLGEFQWVPAGGGDPITFPASNDKLDCKIYFDVNRRTS